MLWRMLSTVGLYLSIPYAQDEVQRPADTISKLDPIDVAGRCRKDVVLRYAKELDLDFAIEAIKWTDSLDDMAYGTISNTHRFCPTSTQYRSHFTSLKNWGILARLANIGPLRYIAKYFSIPKTQTSDRAIFNGRALSKLFRPPPPVNIPSVQEIILLLATKGASGGSACVVRCRYTTLVPSDQGRTSALAILWCLHA